MKYFEFITYPHISLSQARNKEKPFEPAIKPIESLYLNPRKQLALDLALNINELPGNHLQALVFISDTSSHFDTNIINPSRARVASVVDCCQKTVSRATNRLQEEGFIKKKNTCVHIKKDVCRNEFTEIDITPFKKILSFIYKYLPKKHHKLILLFSALRLINISSVPDVNKLLNNINILSISTKENVIEKTDSHSKQRFSNGREFLSIFEPVDSVISSGEVRPCTPKVCPRDLCIDWMPKKETPYSAPPPNIDIYEEDGFEWNQENEYLVAAMYKPFSQYKMMLVRIFQGLKRRKIAEKAAKEKVEYNAGPSGSSLLKGLLDKYIN